MLHNPQSNLLFVVYLVQRRCGGRMAQTQGLGTFPKFRVLVKNTKLIYVKGF